MLALNAGMRDAEMKTLTWGQLNLEKRYLSVGRSKTEAGEGRTIPFNSALYDALARTRSGTLSVLARSGRNGTSSHSADRARMIRRDPSPQ